MFKKKSNPTKIKKPASVENEIDIYNYAASQIDSVRSTYNMIATALTIIFTVGTGIVAFITYKNVSDVKIEARDEYERISNIMIEKFEIMAEREKLDLDKELFIVEMGIKDKISNEFERDNIRELISSTVTEYSDEIIQNKITDEVNPLISNLDLNINELDNKLKQVAELNKKSIIDTKSELNRLLVSTKEKLDSIQDISGFILLVSSAQSGNRDDWDSLGVLSHISGHKFKAKSYDAYTTIMNDYSDPLKSFPIIDTLPITPESKKYVQLDTIKLLYYDLNNEDKSNYDTRKRLMIVKFVWENNNYSQKDKLDFLVFVLENDNRLEVVRYAGKLFTEHTKLKIKYLAVDYLQNWWKENKQKY